MQITPFPLAYPKSIGWQPPSQTAPSPSMSAKVHSLTETIQSLEALLKKRTLMPPSSLSSHPLPPSHPPPLLYHQANLLSPNSLVFSLIPYDKGMLSYLPSGWPLPLPPPMFALHWEQLQSGTLHLPPILWNPFQSPLQPHQPQVWMIIPIHHKLYLLSLPFLQDPATQVQLFQVGATHADPQNTSVQTIPIIIAPYVDELPQDTQTTSVPNFVAPTVSSMFTHASSASTPCLPTITPSWTQPGISSTTRSMREIGVLEMELQDYKEGNVTDVWDPPPFSSLPPSLLSHILWDMITNNKGISTEI